ncbi:pyridoxamine 5'-phosphate oxidase family protein [Paenibacillus abyssi]|uniref:Pyridoxamine 5'-phosphate oxidase n=1 Tax=Paenibacillus abyssi TaxID=1340531 RepID=A0A917FS62_9BACL|nr:pyridoxamine 5'-phosphate oxidase family protein [Paenibacillus abyssi]GGF98918.1 pyridoxamine 5'-phosphate oxidase [Paenibacillus abyssi]
MRRGEFETQEKQDTDNFLHEMSFGFLGTLTEHGWPSVIPLNYVYHQEAIYFHGSRIGEKMKSLAAHPNVTFAVAKEYAIIPSYFSDPLMACPATSYFKSVMIQGRAMVVDDAREKAGALEALMRKLQPEGGYKPIDAEDADYIPRLKGVAVVRIDIVHLSGKFKFGQNLSAQRMEPVLQGLSDRGGKLDEETAALMHKYCPHANKRET